MKRNELVVTKDNYKEVLLKRAIIVCWILLGIAFVIKIFGGNFFNIMSENETFIAICDYIDNSWVKYFIGFIFYILSTSIMMFIANTSLKIKSRRFAISILIATFWWAFKLLFDLQVLSIGTLLLNILDIMVLYIILLQCSRNYLKSLIVVIVSFVFTLVSVFVKGIGIHEVLTDNFVLYTIYLIDYYIMLMLTYLYLKIKR